MKLRVLVGCEFSGTVRRAFRDRGHDAFSCDILPAEDASPHHIHDNVLLHLDDGWDLAIFHPPCTFQAKSGVRWLYLPNGLRNEERWKAMEEGALFFRKLLESPIPRVAVENPVIHRYAREIIGSPHTQVIHPWQFGHGERKMTCLWLRGLPPLRPTKIVEERLPRVHMTPDSALRWKERSRFYPGIAKAMAEQWG